MGVSVETTAYMARFAGDGFCGGSIFYLNSAPVKVLSMRIEQLIIAVEITAIISALIPLIYVERDMVDLVRQYAMFLAWLSVIRPFCVHDGIHVLLLLLRIMLFIAMLDSFTDSNTYLINLSITGVLSITAGIVGILR